MKSEAFGRLSNYPHFFIFLDESLQTLWIISDVCMNEKCVFLITAFIFLRKNCIYFSADFSFMWMMWLGGASSPHLAAV